MLQTCCWILPELESGSGITTKYDLLAHCQLPSAGYKLHDEFIYPAKQDGKKNSPK